jgi:hypothetical protein
VSAAPIRVGQVREIGRTGAYYTITEIDSTGKAWLTTGGNHRTTWPDEYVLRDTVVGWSREHMPPPKRTMDPREIVTGEVRRPSNGLRYAVTFDDEGYRLDYDFGGLEHRQEGARPSRPGHRQAWTVVRFYCNLLELVQEDDLVYRPMWGDQ